MAGRTLEESRRYAKKLSQARLARGLCTACGLHDIEPGHTLCLKHLEALRESAKERRAYRRKHRLCVFCGRPCDRPTVACTFCRKPKGEYWEVKRERKRMEQQAERLKREGERQLINERLTFIPTERGRAIIILKHGLVDGRDKTLEEVGRVFYVTRERIRQIEAESFAFMGIHPKTYADRPKKLYRPIGRPRKAPADKLALDKGAASE